MPSRPPRPWQQDESDSEAIATTTSRGIAGACTGGNLAFQASKALAARRNRKRGSTLCKAASKRVLAWTDFSSSSASSANHSAKNKSLSSKSRRAQPTERRAHSSLKSIMAIMYLSRVASFKVDRSSCSRRDEISRRGVDIRAACRNEGATAFCKLSRQGDRIAG